MLVPTGFTFAQETERDYYLEGQFAAKSDYTGGGAMVGGLISGFALGIIGWGIGYLIVANSDIDVPQHYLMELNPTQRMKFELGYSDYVKKKKKGNFNIGGAIGTLGAVVYTVSQASE